MIEKNYQPAELEKKWYQFWEASGFFQPQSGDLPFCIVLPPPNVTGTLHMGHAFQVTIMDALIRYHRMSGYQTLWQGGTDHAGIATQIVVEKQLLSQGIDKASLTREAFIQKIWEWKALSGNTITQQMRRLGASIDWSRERFTMDEGLSQAVREVFVRLHEEDLIYRGQRLVNWDPTLRTAVSDLEVIFEEEEGNLWHIRYPLLEEKGALIVATTRPETLLGDVAVAVHPDDLRYQMLIGKQVVLPLCNRSIPIIADPFVDPAFGTGCVKITPAHDFNDHEVAKRHNLPLLSIFDESANINHIAPLAYQGLSRFAAREAIIADLAKASLLEKTEPYRLKVPRSERTGDIIEPYLTDQWFVKTKPLAGPAIEAVEKGKVTFLPDNWTKIYFDWMHNIQDWCISRQISWGHPIPAWYDEEGKVYVGHSEEAVRQKYGLTRSLTPDPDVLDTWFSSALWPFSTLGWPNDKHELQLYYPTNVLVTGFDIIFFWVARMIMMGLKFVGEVPFRTVFVTGLIQDNEGQKMSKSKGNILDPLDLIDGIDLDALIEKRTKALMQPNRVKQIEKTTRKQFPEGIARFGTDPLRFTFCALASTSRHIRFDFTRMEGYRNFCNKLWNAARFVLINAREIPSAEREKGLQERWIGSLWQKTKKRIHSHFANYRFDIVAQTLYDFIWNDYCDWYLELSKCTLSQEATRFTLLALLEEILRALHPLMPFITEEIWQKLPPLLGKNYFSTETHSVMTQPYPQVDESQIDEKAEEAMEQIKGFITAVRTLRAEMNLPLHQLPVFYRTPHLAQSNLIQSQASSIKILAKISEITWLKKEALPPVSASAIIDELEVFIPLSGLIDKATETKRLSKEIEKAKKELHFYQQKLDNPHYVNKAPPSIVEQERKRLQTTKEILAKLNQHLSTIDAL